ncbi:MAG TPA: ergothioneine biosynthesis glutamate--cysteine ligase EgtA [Streptosporangiaceae bacterium]|nr:ergothioneine biosynthesis glutamate--cysteine ligase EgtA [Streptosporangiaceae bacterium]
MRPPCGDAETEPAPRGDDAPPLTEGEAEEHAHGICFKTGPPSRVGVELEWLVCDGRDPALPVDQQRVAAALATLGEPGALPGRGRLTTEPGGQVELSSAPASGLAGCVLAAGRDLAAVRQAIEPAGLSLAGHGLDPIRPPRRVLDLPRYAAMEEFFDRRGPWGRVMMCSTASVQVCVDAGLEHDGLSGFRWRWRLLHAIGPVLVSAFANSPLRSGRPSGWKSTRQAVWFRLDPSRTRPPAYAEPTVGAGPRHDAEMADPRAEWASYVLDAEVMVVRRPGSPTWTAPSGLTFRDWVRGGAGERRPTAEDLTYHMSTLFPPVRPRGHMELRMIDAQPGDGWVVPAAVVYALTDDPVAAEAAMAAAEPVWHQSLSSAPAGPEGQDAAPGRSAGQRAAVTPWLRAARLGPADPVLARAGLEFFAAADAALGRLAAPPQIRDAVAEFAERYVTRGRCPADDVLDALGGSHEPTADSPAHHAATMTPQPAPGMAAPSMAAPNMAVEDH